MQIDTYRWNELNAAQRKGVLQRPAASQDSSIRDGVEQIIAAVRTQGDTALRALTREYDGASLDKFRVSDAEIAAATEQLDAEQIAAIDLAIANVSRFHEQLMPKSVRVETSSGVYCERVSQPLDSVGLYVPAGTAPLPSTAIMLAVPARIAACPQILLCTPPRPDGNADPAVLAAASRAGITDIYTVGGAQAVAALAYGTESIPKVRKIFGPGNAWVTCAKTLVSMDPQGAAIDMPAGPSEVLVIADEHASAEFVAADLLSQAEHGSDSQTLLITTDAAQAQAVQEQLAMQLQSLSRAKTAAEALRNSRIIITDTVATAIEISNLYAPEHLILLIEEARVALPTIRNAGSVFVGPWSPEAIGDYCSGTNHVLPTYGHAAAYSGLGIDQFMRQMTIQEASRAGLERLAPAVLSLAALEGLDAHAAAVWRRLATSS